jgi:hypothetical protein
LGTQIRRRLVPWSGLSLVGALLVATVAPLVGLRPAQAAGFVQDLGRAEVLGGGTTVTVATSGAVTAGNSVILVIDYNAGGPLTLACSDPVNGAYTTDATSTDPVAHVAVCSKHNVQALPAGSTITATWSAPSGSRRAVAMEYSGIVSPFFDQSASTGNLVQTGSTQTTATAPVTSQPREVLVGGFLMTGTVATTGFAPGDNGTVNPCAETDSPTYAALPGIGATAAVSTYLLHCTVSATGAYRASSTTTAGESYVGVLATYRVASPPSVVTVGSALAYTENAGATAVDPGLAVTDPDSASQSGATVAITVGFVAAEDVLTFADQNGITGSYDGGTGVLTLTGTSSVANYQAALRSVAYTNTSENPTTAARTVTFRVTDDTARTSTAATRQVAVAAVNDAPINTVPGAQTTAGDTARVFSTANGNAISIADVDAGSGTVQVPLGVPSGTLGLGGTAGLTVTGNGTGTVTATGTVANLNAGLQGLTFTPLAGSSGTVGLTITTNDQGNTGSGGAQQDQDAVQITVNALPTATPTPTGTLPPTSTPTSTATSTPSPTATVIPSTTATATSIPPAPPRDENREDSPRTVTEEQRRQRQRTNAGNRADMATEGNVTEVTRTPDGLVIVIANADGLVRIVYPCGSSCPTIRVGNYVQVDGTKDNEQLYQADEVTVTR